MDPVSPAALLLATALLLQAPVQETAYVDHDGAFGWTCWAPVTIGPYKGSVSRHYGRKLQHSAYIMQVELADPSDPHKTSWAVDPRPEGPPSSKKRDWPFAVREADAFRSGPGYVQVDFKWEPTALAGPLWVHFWGDGAYAGGQMLLSARNVRRYYGKRSPAGSATANPGSALIAKLVRARSWTAVATDSSGGKLGSETFEPPSPEAAEAAFREARAKIDALERRFAVDHEPREEGGALCSDEEDPAASI